MNDAASLMEFAREQFGDELAVYKECYEADEAWRKASAIGSSNEDYLEAAERLGRARQAVQKLRGEA